MRESPLINASVCAPDFFLAYKVRVQLFSGKKGATTKLSDYVSVNWISEPSWTLHLREFLTLFPKETGQEWISLARISHYYLACSPMVKVFETHTWLRFDLRIYSWYWETPGSIWIIISRRSRFDSQPPSADPTGGLQRCRFGRRLHPNWNAGPCMGRPSYRGLENHYHSIHQYFTKGSSLCRLNPVRDDSFFSFSWLA